MVLVINPSDIYTFSFATRTRAVRSAQIELHCTATKIWTVTNFGIPFLTRRLGKSPILAWLYLSMGEWDHGEKPDGTDPVPPL